MNNKVVMEGFTQVINEWPHRAPNRETIIDHVWSNWPSRLVEAGVTYNEDSDHKNEGQEFGSKKKYEKESGITIPRKN